MKILLAKSIIILSVYALFSSVKTNAQTTGAAVIKDDQHHTNPLPFGVNYKHSDIARDVVYLLPGFKALGTSDFSVVAKTDPTIVVPISGIPSGIPGAEFDSYLPISTATDATYTVSKTLQLGYTKGDYSVTPTGGSAYNIPISVSPGSNGMQPNVSIVYNSQAGNGVLGYGWELTGIPSIVRVAPTIYQDGVQNGVTFTTNDRLSFNGQRLYPTSGSYWDIGTVYGTEAESFSTITTKQNSDNTISFEVITRDGTIMQFGDNPDARHTANATDNTSLIMSWKVSKITDINGNYITFTYLKGKSVSKIEYTGNVGKTPYNSIIFNYSQRQDQNHSYFNNGGKTYDFTEDLLLKSITVLNEDTKVKKYIFDYVYDVYSKLVKVTESDANDNSLNPTKITWDANHSSSNLGTEFPISSLIQFTPTNTYTADFNGDGYTDVVGVDTRSSDLKMYLGFDVTANSTGFLNVGAVNFNGYLPKNGFVGDLDNDGKDEFYESFLYNPISSDDHHNSEIYQYKYEGGTLQQSSFYSGASNSIESPTLKFLSGDFNGDKNNDYLIYSEGSGAQFGNHYINFEKSNLILTSNPQFDHVTGGGIGFGYTVWADNIVAGDFNGNGKTDIQVIYTSGYEILEYNNLTQKFEQIVTGAGSYISGIYGDFNGDGKTDVFNSNTIYYSDGSGYNYSMPITFGTSGTNSKISVGDFNGDGITEFARIYVNSANVGVIEYYFKTGSTYENETAILSKNIVTSAVYSIGDYNADGTSDFIFLNAGNKINNTIVYTFNNSHPLKVKKITDGFGKFSSFSYLPLINYGNFYDPTLADGTALGRIPESSVFIDKNFKMPLVAVSSMIVSDGLGSTNETDYSYKGARIHLQGRGFLGFESVTSISNDLKTKSVTNFKVDPTYFVPYVSSQYQYAYPSLALKIHSTYDNTFVAVGGTGSLRYLTYVNQSIDYNDLTGTSQTRASVIDNSTGNVTKTTTSYGSEGITVTDYSDFMVVNGVQRAQTETVTKTRTSKPAFIMTTGYTFDAKGRVQLTVVTDANADWQAVEIKNRDLYGNPTQIETSAKGVSLTDFRTQTFTYDSYGRFVTNSSNALGQTASATYNTLYAKPEVVTGTDGLTTTNVYDTQGRLIKKTGPDGILTTYAYSFAVSPPISTALYYTQETTPGKPTLVTYYDMLDRKVYSQTDGASGTIISKQLYNAQGQISQTSIPKYGTTGAEQWIIYDYYETNRLKSQNDRGRTTNYSYTTNSTKVTVGNPDGTSTTQTTNAYGDVVNTTDALGIATTYTYHSCGSPDKISNGVDVVINYYANGRKKDITEPSSKIIKYEYTPFGELSKITDLKGITTYTYNKLSQPLTKNIVGVNANVPGLNTTYAYSAAKGAVGKLLSATSDNGTSQTYTYDPLGRLTRTSEIAAGRTFNTDYGYDGYSNITSAIYPSDLQLKYTYDGHGFMTAINNAVSNALIWQLTSANALGQLTAGKFGNNISSVYTYDAYSMLQSIVAGSVFNYQTNFDANNGNLTFRQQTVNSFNLQELFPLYDNNNRLKRSERYINANPYGSTDITYDPNERGNISSKSDVGIYNYPNPTNAPDELDHISVTSTLVPTTQQDITYTAFSKVNTITEGVNFVSFIYGPDGERRVMETKQNGVLQKTTYYNGNYELVFDASGNKIERTYIQSPYGLVAMQYKVGNTSQIFYTHTDHLGSVLVLSNQSGGIAEQYSYDAWGRRRSPTSWDYTVPPVVPTYLTRGFTFHEHLDQFNLINMNGRLYDPLVGRMLSPDPVLHIGASAYSYADGNPLKYVDPDGKEYGYGATTPATNYNYNNYNYGSGTYNSTNYNYNYTSNYSSGSFNYGNTGVTYNYMAGSSIATFTTYSGNQVTNGYYDFQKGSLSTYSYSYKGQYEMAQEVINRDYSAGVNKFLNENYGINTQTVTTGSNLFLKTYAQYQYGMNQPITVDASSLDFSRVTQKNLTPLEDGTYGLDLYRVNPTSQTSLALGKITLVSQGNNQFSILDDKYDFNIETQNGFTKRNIATFGAAILHDNPFSFVFGGPYIIKFVGTITIKP